jgi:hypothetical protein
VVNGKPWDRPSTVSSAIEPGAYEITYEAPPHPRKFAVSFEAKPNLRYSPLINLDSPWAYERLNIPGANLELYYRELALVHHPAHGFVLVYPNGESLRWARSRDLKTWTDEPLPIAEQFSNVRPSLAIDRHGTIWLAYFSDRLNPTIKHSGRFDLFLASCRNGKSWDRPRKLEAPTTSVGASPINVQLAVSERGRCVVYFHGRAAAADSFADITKLEVVRPDVPGSSRLAADERGGLHLVTWGHDQPLAHSVLEDGLKWSEPVKLVDGPMRDAQVLVRRGRLTVWCRAKSERVQRSARLEDLPKLGPEVVISTHLQDGGGTSVTVTPSGEVLMVLGADALGVLRAKLDDLLPAGE